MRIDGIELYLVENAFHKPWRTAYGSDPGNSVVIARMVSGSHEGWSEASPLPDPNYSYEYGKGAFQVCKRFLAPLTVGKEFDSARELNAAISHVKGNPFAKAAIEMAWWTLKADMEGKTLGQLLGATTDKVEVGDGWGICDSYDELIANIGKSFDEGYTRVKLKIAPGWDEKMLEAVRSVFPNQTIHVDGNSAYRYNEHADLLKRLDRFHLAMIEQPFQVGDIYYHGKLQSQMDTPICLDETITEPWQAEVAAEMKACKYINIKPARVGGLQNSLDINEICRQAGIGCWVGGMMESDVGKAICTELAAIPNMVYSHDITPANLNYPFTITKRELVMDEKRMLTLATEAGTPVKPDLEKMLQRVNDSAKFGVCQEG
ncbi:MAG: o-succinylbenzoate synthase [Clostridia bacterium]|nr:o-succinylbenzoate synthase [Clostridia bacterium]